MAKAMGNGFPIGGIVVSPKFEASFGLLGTTFGGNHLACSAALAVLEVMESENLMENATKVGDYAIEKLKEIEGVVDVRGKGLMIGIELSFPVADIRKKLLFEDKIFTGASSNKNTVRLLPAYNVTTQEIDQFIECFKNQLAAVPA